MWDRSCDPQAGNSSSSLAQVLGRDFLAGPVATGVGVMVLTERRSIQTKCREEILDTEGGEALA